MAWHDGLNRRDVAVVLGCIVFAFLALGAVGEGGRRRAQATVCQANLRQWHGIFQDYLEENDGKFFTGADDMGRWWPLQLAPQYQDWKKNRAWFCPAAVTPLMTKSGQYVSTSPTFNAWGIYRTATQTVYKGRTYVMNPHGLAGSYALNGYMVSVARWYEGGIPASEGCADLKSIPDAYRVPLFIDALRFDLWPRTIDLPAADESSVLFSDASNYMSRCCINRHDGTVNCLFVDGSVRKMGLKELWTLQWSRTFNTSAPWTTAGGVRPESWPQWMRNFKDYGERLAGTERYGLLRCAPVSRTPRSNCQFMVSTELI